MFDTLAIHKFEIPYNFDLKLIDGLQILGIPANTIDCIYTCPFPEDYPAIQRDSYTAISQMSKKEFEEHMAYIEDKYPGKLQLLLQQNKPDILMHEDLLNYYIDLGFKNFCCGTVEQAKIVKHCCPEAKIVGSITIKPTQSDLFFNQDYKDLFDAFVLDFSYTRDIQKIKLLPRYYDYIILVNSRCNSSCDGYHHWFPADPTQVPCPGLINKIGFAESCLIRPMDLKYFDPYIKVYKIQDRGWPTRQILRDVILYTTDYNLYPGIKYDEDLYEQHTTKDSIFGKPKNKIN